MGVLGRMGGKQDATVVESRIRAALAELAPLVAHQATRVELIRFTVDGGVALLAVEGGCPDCDMPAAALIQGIAAHLRLRVPEVRDVRAADPDLSSNG